VSFLVVAQSSSEVPEGLMNNPVCIQSLHFLSSVGTKDLDQRLLNFFVRGPLFGFDK
jgi:hypothetical protein